MKPNFALDLSHDGIVLLHRASAGWHHMGEVSLDAPDMAAELEQLRDLATAVSTRGLSSKLVIPDSQILYRSIPDPGPDTATRDAAIRAALEGATPYALGDLVWDWRTVAGRLQIAVVARETLEEAEAFATEHRFNPVTFVAMPDPALFGGEPFFGRTRSADALIGADVTVEPDREAMHLLSHRATAKAPAPAPAPEETVPEETVPEAEIAEVPAETAPGEAASGMLPIPLVATETDEKAFPATDAAPAEPLPPETGAGEEAPMLEDAAPEDFEDPAPEAPRATGAQAAPGGDEPTPRPDPAADATEPEAPSEKAEKAKDEAEEIRSEPDQDPATAFHSHRAELPQSGEEAEAAPRLAALPSRVFSTAPAAADIPPAPRVDAATRAPDPSPHVSVTSGEVPLFEADETPKPRLRKSPKTGPLPEPPPMPAPAAPARPDPQSDAAAKPGGRALGALKGLSGRAAQAKAKRKAKATPPADIGTAPLPIAVTEGETLLPLSDRAAGLDRMENARDEAEALTVFGARRQARAGTGKPRRLGLILTALLILLLLVAGLLAGLLPEDEAPTDASGPAASLEQTAPRDLAGTEGEAESDPDGGEAPTTTVLVEPDAAGTGVDESELAYESDGTEEEPELLDQAVLPEPPAGAEAADAPDPAEVAQRYAATGIWPLAPEGGDGEVAEDRLEDVYIASIDPEIEPQDALALAPGAGHSAETPPRAATPPAPPGTVYDYDDDGFLRATPEGTVTPDGVVVYAGRPEITTRPRPGSDADTAEATPADPLEAATDVDNPVRLSLASARPSLRPEDLIEDNERANLGGLTRAQLGGFRPAPRPVSEQERATEDATEEGASAPSPTAPDVAVSLVPQARPQDFEKLAAAAAAAANAASDAASEPEGETTARSAAAQVTARVPEPALPSSAPTSVARAATVENAINLRKLNLMGVYGGNSDRRALVRLPSGRFAKVQVGDKLDGGRVQSIGSSTLTYVKKGRAYTIQVGS
ncbi:hypothetical protein [Celeribacter indicus]|uniref:Type IV pilus biogenesis n=1 Tax=Celeribacter indicus TaxID=1208324 RepID=A0A0B5DYA4_9RHOB|nr:hypothetical protein [Celeribacter indicus]AJE47989.1 hypothetical protein P73_3274 [Celeribacter indicus]SDW28811.1 hypothetical protein SAMN05443573_102264 [Celeribacter indicus]